MAALTPFPIASRAANAAAAGPPPRVVVVDNYDSFTHNLMHALTLAGATCEVVMNDADDVGALLARKPDGFVISAGPCTPAESGVSLPLARALLAGDVGPALLGVCLGHQAIAVAAGGRVLRARQPMHGKLTAIRHDRGGCLADMPSPFEAARYNSLVADPAALGPLLTASAWSEDGDLMGLRHRTRAIEGIQFHPESALCPGATRVLARWVDGLRRRALRGWAGGGTLNAKP